MCAPIPLAASFGAALVGHSPSPESAPRSGRALKLQALVQRRSSTNQSASMQITVVSFNDQLVTVQVSRTGLRAVASHPS